ncbi:MAG TPA: hypothetical protein VFH51_18620 [Myxococcota bacterium]|nr:hypothetical protein [Myxococcota bacterium]
MSGRFRDLVLLASLAAGLAACGAGVPLRLRVDEFTTAIDLDKTTAELEATLQGQGLLPAGSAGLPEIWPDSMPAIRYTVSLQSPPQVINLTPDDPAQKKKYAQVMQYAQAINRIEVNRVALRVEANSLNVDLPALRLEGASDMDASPYDRKAWQTVGNIPSGAAREAADLPMTFVPGGATFLDSALSSAAKRFALRTNGALVFDTDVNPQKPHGKATLRVIMEATFFVAVDKL